MKLGCGDAVFLCLLHPSEKHTFWISFGSHWPLQRWTWFKENRWLWHCLADSTTFRQCRPIATLKRCASEVIIEERRSKSRDEPGGSGLWIWWNYCGLAASVLGGLVKPIRLNFQRRGVAVLCDDQVEEDIASWMPKITITTEALAPHAHQQHDWSYSSENTQDQNKLRTMPVKPSCLEGLEANYQDIS